MFIDDFSSRNKDSSLVTALCYTVGIALQDSLTHEKVATSLNIQGMHKDSFNELVESDYKLIWLLEHCMMGRWDAPALPPR